ncbi:unnamed protein product [Caretta caretta]
MAPDHLDATVSSSAPNNNPGASALDSEDSLPICFQGLSNPGAAQCSACMISSSAEPTTTESRQHCRSRLTAELAPPLFCWVTWWRALPLPARGPMPRPGFGTVPMATQSTGRPLSGDITRNATLEAANCPHGDGCQAKSETHAQVAASTVN